MTSEVTQAALESCPNPWCNSRKTVDCEIRAAEAPILMPSRSSAEWAVACPVCPLQTPYFDTEAEAIAAWNTRLTAQSGDCDLCQGSGVNRGDQLWPDHPPACRACNGSGTAQSGEGRSGEGEDALEIRALKAAKQFIENGIEMGFIRMPDTSTPDSAHDTLPLIRAALNARQSGEGERLREALELAKIKLRRYMDVHGPNGLNPDTYVGGYQAEIEAVLTTIDAALRATDEGSK